MRNHIKTNTMKVIHLPKKRITIEKLEVKKESFYPVGPITRRIETQTIYQ